MSSIIAIKRLRPAITALMLGLWCSAGFAAAELQSLPRWEVGIGLGVLSLPFYRGADSGRTYIVPVPYLQYRGEHVRVDEEGIRGALFSSDNARLDFSLAGGVPVSSDGNSARHGMPSLDPTVEIGPSLEFLLWYPEARDRALWLKFPLRTALSVALKNIEYQGWVFAPYLDYRMVAGGPAKPWTITLSLGPQFADRHYHDYFYEVTSAYASPQRPEYHATSGYSGSRMTLGVQKKFDGYWLGTFVRYDTLQGAVFSDSPLVQQRHYYALGMALIKLLAVSKQAAGSP
jgi:outer membrane protein